MGKRLDLTGQKFNRLTAIKLIGSNSKNLSVWQWMCDCGNVCEAVGSYVKRGRTKSCGCLAQEILLNRNKEKTMNLIGKTYGKLTVQKFIEYRPDSRGKSCAWYMCRCECGNTCEAMGNRLQCGFKLSCGCLSSYGENQIEQALMENNIPYSTQKTFDELRSKETNTLLRFDFCIYNNVGDIKCLIEYDGRSHRTGPEGHWTNAVSLEQIQERDRMKDVFCFERNIPLYRIPSDKITIFSLENILHEKFLVKGE